MPDGVNDLFAGYLTEAEQAALLKKTVRTLRTWRKTRTGPAWTTLGKEVLYHQAWNAEWLAAGKQDPVRSRARRTRRTDNHATT